MINFEQKKIKKEINDNRGHYLASIFGKYSNENFS